MRIVHAPFLRFYPCLRTVCACLCFVYEYAEGFDGGSRFARAKRFADRKDVLQGRIRQSQQLIIVERGAPLKALSLRLRHKDSDRVFPIAVFFVYEYAEKDFGKVIDKGRNVGYNKDIVYIWRE